MISPEELGQLMIDFANDARAIERLTAITQACGAMIEQVNSLLELDGGLRPEAFAIVEHMRDASQAAERAATFVIERQRARHAKLADEI